MPEQPRTFDEIVQHVSRGITAFGRIKPRLSAQTALAGVMEEMRQTGLLRSQGEPAEGMIVSEPSGSGKSITAQKYRRRVALAAGCKDEERGPVRIITIDEQGTPKSFWSSILEHLGDPDHAVGSEKILKKRLKKALVREGVELLIIDEFNHIADKEHAREVVNGVKNMLTDGWVPIVVMGTHEELAKLPKNDAFESRLIDCPGLPRMRWAASTPPCAWTKLCGELDDGMVGAGIVQHPALLAEDARAKALCAVADGLLGRLIWLLKSALRQVLRRGGDRIELQDLSAAAAALMLKFPRKGAVNPLEALL